MICEHDLFKLFEISKSSVNIDSFINVLKFGKINWAVQIDDPSGKLFLDAFSKDLLIIEKVIKNKQDQSP